MLQAARLAPNLLRDAADRVVEFLHAQINQDGGAKDRSGKSDLYYTVFAVEGLLALDVEPPFESVAAYLRRFESGADLDFVHRACLARCWAAMPDGSLDPTTASRIIQYLEEHRCSDGGYHHERDSETGTVYHCFLALGAYQDLGEELPDRAGVGQCLGGLRTDDGAYANDHGLKLGTTPATAAAVTVLRHLDFPVPQGVADWLAACGHPDGGFLAIPNAPLPDLLSTATTLHALAGMGFPLETFREPCLDFVDRLWTGKAFVGHQADPVEDSEYVYYALLALGHLSS